MTASSFFKKRNASISHPKESLIFRVSKVLTAAAPIFALTACGGGGETTFGNSDDPFFSDATIEEVAQSLGFVTPIAYVRRPTPTVAFDSLDAFTDSLEDRDMLDLDAFDPGATLWIRAGASINANEFNITEGIFPAGELYDIKDLSVSPDGEKLLFAMHAPEADPDDPVFTWNIWEFDLISNQLTRVIEDDIEAEQGHDISPAYLANGDIIFASTRQAKNGEILNNEGKIQYSGQEEDSAQNANEPSHTFNLHVIDNDQTIRQLTFNQSHDFAPIVQSSGKILYSRWDNIANVNQISLYEINTDGSEHQFKYGYESLADPDDGGVGYLSQPRIAANGQLVAITKETENTIINLGGDIVEVDVENFVENNTPTFVNSGLTTQAINSLTPNNLDIANLLDPFGRYLSAWPLHDGSNRIVVSWMECRSLSLSDPNDIASPLSSNATPCALNDDPVAPALPRFQIWMLDPQSRTQRIVTQADENEYFSEVVAMETIPLPELSTGDIDPLLASNEEAILNIRSIYDVNGVDVATPDIATLADPGQTDPDTIGAKFLRLVKAVSIPDEDVLDFDNSIFGVNRSQLMREIVGYVPIEPDGSVRAIIPANIPLMLSVVDRTGKRISPRHQNWIHFAAGETLDCRGCSIAAGSEPHGRPDALPPSVHVGGSVTLPYPNTEPSLYSPSGGESMAEIFAFVNSINGHRPQIDLDYVDRWTDESGSLNKAAPFQINYADLNTDNPTSEACQSTWTSNCRIAINYEQHIQPIWELARADIADGLGGMTPGTCTNCHTTNGGTQVPAGQLDLGNTPSDIDADHFTSYRELLRTDVEQVLNVTAVADRLWECNVVDPGTNLPVTIPDPDADPDIDPDATIVVRELRNPTVIPASMNEAGANFASSVNFFICLTNDNACRTNIGDTLPSGFPDECIEFAGDPVTSQPIVNHNGLLSEAELRLIAEWLDIGAQYYNNPFDAP